MRWVALVAALLTISVLRASPATAGRPLETEDAATLSRGAFELELSADYLRLSDENVWAGRAVLNAGIWTRLEARLELPVVLLEPDESRSRGGFGDVVVGVKWRLIDEQPTVPAFLGAVAVRLPTGDTDRELGAKDVDVTVVGVVAKTLGSFVLHGNVAYTFVTANRDLDIWTFAASIEHQVTERLSLVAEALGIAPTHHDHSMTGRFRAGLIYAIRPNVRIDGAIGHGLTSQSPRLLATVGVTIAF